MAPTNQENNILTYPKILQYYDKDVRNSDGSIKLRNPNVEKQDQDILYHLAIGSGSHDLEEMFGDVRFVCMGGTPKRMEGFAHYIMKQINYKLPSGTQLSDISRMSYRYSMFKVGPVLCLSHGMGIPSVGILLHEVIKLMYHAKCKDPIFFRLGTCGGIGIEGGNLAISESAVDGMMNPYLELPVLGKMKRRPATLDKELCEELSSLSEPNDPFTINVGKTMCTYDFYEGQGRIDGAFCDYKEEEKISFLKKIRQEGVINMEMESLCFAALCNEAGIRSAVICVTLLNRINGDQVSTPKEILNKWQEYPQVLVARYIRKELGLHNPPREHDQVVKDLQKLGIVKQESASVE